MPAIHFNSFQTRANDSGRTFSVIFAIIASVVIAGSLIWGVCLPRIRKKRCLKLDNVPATGNDVVEVPRRQSLQHFPSHPALLRDFRKHSPNHIRQYDPRVETPFKNSPPPGEAISLPLITPRHPIYQASPHNQGSIVQFSPAKARHPTKSGWLVHRTSASIPSVTIQRFGQNEENSPCNEDFISLPEPLLLKTKPAGRAPPLTKQLEQFPMPGSNSSLQSLTRSMDVSTHLQHKKSNMSFTALSTLSSEADTMSCTIAGSKTSLIGRSQKSPDRLIQLKLENPANSNPAKPPSHGQAIQNHTTWTDQEFSMPAKILEQPGRIFRAGTITRPQTPAARLRVFYDHPEDAESRETDDITSREPTSSTKSITNSTTTTGFKCNSPPTSPLSHAGGVDRPPCKSTHVHGELASGTPKPGFEHELNTPSSSHLHSTGGLDRPCKSLGNNSNRPKVGRPRPARLNLLKMSVAQSNTRVKHSISSLGSILIPPINSKRPSIPASSIYSRDTKGLSIGRSPVSPSFKTNEIRYANVIPSHYSIHRRASSMVMVQRKVDDWNLYTDQLDFSILNTPTLKRTLSDVGPQSPTLPSPTAEAFCTPTTSPGFVLPRISIGRASDDIFRDSHASVDKRMSLEGQLATKASVPATKLSQKAPGDAEWI